MHSFFHLITFLWRLLLVFPARSRSFQWEVSHSRLGISLLGANGSFVTQLREPNCANLSCAYRWPVHFGLSAVLQRRASAEGVTFSIKCFDREMFHEFKIKVQWSWYRLVEDNDGTDKCSLALAGLLWCLYFTDNQQLFLSHRLS